MYKRVMFVLNGGDSDSGALDTGLQLARTFSAEVVFCSVVCVQMLPVIDTPGLLFEPMHQYLDAVKDLARAGLASAYSLASERGIKATGMVDCWSDEAQGIAFDAAERECDVIVIESGERPGLQRLLFGSVAARLIRLTPVPVLVCKTGNKSALASQPAEDVGRASGTRKPEITLNDQQARRAA